MIVSFVTALFFYTRIPQNALSLLSHATYLFFFFFYSIKNYPTGMSVPMKSIIHTLKIED